MDINWLEDFLALVETGGFSKAAESRAVSQSSFSRRIQALETWVGAALFDRDTHTIRLTPAGERFCLTAEEVVRQLKLGREAALSAANASSNTLRFASTHALSLTFFPSFLRDMEYEAFQSAVIELTANSMMACEKLMVEGRANFLLCHHHETAYVRLEQGFRSLVVGGDTLIPVAARGVLEQAVEGDLPHLAFTKESGMGRIIRAALEKRGQPVAPTPVFASHLASVLTAMALDGRGVAWLPLSLIADHLEAGRLARVEQEQQGIDIEIRLWRPRARQAPVAEEFWQKARVYVEGAESID
ncbi:LysR family transcriptional regulator [Kordiimonas aestuarii]|uniref:LysR family transcriptional regulator n=1 Tax=Kordiimonas aestuarii TaxID=1005925 RepID=UPI0021D0FCE4|nr:LysR family transcriptional regulator [Kordiimonas aestuarii]